MEWESGAETIEWRLYRHHIRQTGTGHATIPDAYHPCNPEWNAIIQRRVARHELYSDSSENTKAVFIC